jgi:hypothetical protein
MATDDPQKKSELRATPALHHPQTAMEIDETSRTEAAWAHFSGNERSGVLKQCCKNKKHADLQSSRYVLCKSELTVNS